MSNSQIVNFDRERLEREHMARYNFHMKNSIDISSELVKEAEMKIDRINAINQINKYVDYMVMVQDIEKGLFEASLLHVTMKKLDNSYVSSIYKNKLHNICINLDEKNEKIENKTLLKALYRNELKPYMIAFLTPQQMHPKRWESIMQKKMRDDDAMYNIETTDEFECPNCNERKCTVDYIQLRSADEPASKFITCVVCGNTIIL
jgi:DNA-directed RNA polymerase subunit M/transcription elongation factor TFIIS